MRWRYRLRQHGLAIAIAPALRAWHFVLDPDWPSPDRATPAAAGSPPRRSTVTPGTPSAIHDDGGVADADDEAPAAVPPSKMCRAWE